MSDARYMDARSAADYLSISRTTFDQLVEQGRLPRPIELTPRLLRWDKDAIDAALAGAPCLPQPAASASDIAREIADDILAERRVPPNKDARRRFESRISSVARNGQKN